MKLIDLNKAIVNNNIPHVCIFYGPEYAIMDVYINQIASRINGRIIKCDSLENGLNTLRVRSLDKRTRIIKVSYDTSFFSDDKILDMLKIFNTSDYLILRYNELDKRSKFYKQFENIITEFSHMPEDNVKVMLQPVAKNLNDTYLTELVVKNECDYSKCLQEFSKIEAYSIYHSISYDEAYIELKNSGIIRFVDKDVFNPFIDAVMMHKNCIDLYQQLVRSGESNIRILATLYINFKQQLMVQSIAKPTKEATGLDGWIIQRCLQRRVYSLTQLVNILDEIITVEQGIKNGTHEESTCIEYLLARIY